MKLVLIGLAVMSALREFIAPFIVKMNTRERILVECSLKLTIW